jgi:hypothetical protein
MKLTRRQVRAAVSAAAGAAAYLAASEIGARKIRLSTLWVLSTVATAAMAAHAAGKQPSVMSRDTKARLDSMLNDGFATAGDLHVGGAHFIDGDTHITGSVYGAGTGILDFGGQTHQHGHQMNGVQEIYDNGSDIGIHGGNFYTNGGSIHLGGSSQGTAHVYG